MASSRRSAPTPPSPPAAAQQSYSWEEYKLYFESTEKVVDRRIALNTWNYGICVAILAAAGALATWALSKNDLRLALFLAIMMLMVMGMLLCWHWSKQLKDLKLLNNAKFDVINNMAPLVKFPDGIPSYQVFKKEWDILDKKKATSFKWGLKVKVLNSSGSEFVLPYAFGFIFASIMAMILIVSFHNRDELTKHPFDLPKAENTETAPKCVGKC